MKARRILTPAGFRHRFYPCFGCLFHSADQFFYIIYSVAFHICPDTVYPHSFRHRFAKNFLKKYNDIALLADLMGHDSIETTRIYLTRSSAEQKELLDRIITW